MEHQSIMIIIVTVAITTIVSTITTALIMKVKKTMSASDKVDEISKRFDKMEEKINEKFDTLAEQINENDEKQNVLIFAVGALFDKTFHGIENGRKERAENELQDIIYQLNNK